MHILSKHVISAQSNFLEDLCYMDYTFYFLDFMVFLIRLIIFLLLKYESDFSLLLFSTLPL